MGTFTLMRHGEAAFESMRDRNLIGGCHDWIPLSERGIAQVEARLAELKAAGFDLILSSPMTRALHSAAIISRALGLPLRVEFDLHEWLPDLTFRYESFEPVQLAIDDRKANNNEWPCGQMRAWETFSQVRKRVLPVLRRYEGAGHVLVVCHHTLIESLTRTGLSCAEFVPYGLPTA